MIRRLRPLCLFFLFPALLAACPGDEDAGSTLVVGVQTTDLTGALGNVLVTTKVDGVESRETTSGSALPKEIEIRGGPGAVVDVDIVANPAVPGGPTLTRIATARLAAGKKLLRVNLEARCIGIACAANETCTGGRCVPREVPFDLLEDYEQSWPTAPPDVCRPPSHGAPEVILGTGQTDYGTLSEEQMLQLEKGPQGGHHIWVAARMKNLRQSGSLTTITAKFADDPGAAPVPPAAFVFTFDRDEGAYCKIFGLRYQVDTGAADLRTEYKRFLGKRLTVTVEVSDSTGARGQSSRTIKIADTLLCPDGTGTCNVP